MEVDVVMDATTPLWKAHDLSQQLQDKIEVLPNVERAFVHVDHETTHYPVCGFCSGWEHEIDMCLYRNIERYLRYRCMATEIYPLLYLWAVDLGGAVC